MGGLLRLPHARKSLRKVLLIGWAGEARADIDCKSKPTGLLDEARAEPMNSLYNAAHNRYFIISCLP